jgi:hypothetical protein
MPTFTGSVIKSALMIVRNAKTQLTVIKINHQSELVTKRHFDDGPSQLGTIENDGVLGLAKLLLKLGVVPQLVDESPLGAIRTNGTLSTN